jgi:nucleoside-diphosphate-sugar epimerase
MKLTIIAATGGVGAGLLQQALTAGHDVTAVVRNAGKLSRPVKVITTDLAAPDQAALESAVAGADAVLSGLGPHSNSDAGIASDGTRAIVAAMKATSVRRIVAVSAAPVSTSSSRSRPSSPKHDPGDGFLMRHLFSHVAGAMFGKVYADLRADVAHLMLHVLGQPGSIRQTIGIAT